MNERINKHNNKQYRERLAQRKRRQKRKRLLKRLCIITMTIAAILLLFLVVLGLYRLIFQPTTTFHVLDNEVTLPWNISQETVDIVLDAGHGGKDQGTNAGNVLEKDINLQIAQKTQQYLEKEGYKVGMVRTDDTFVKLGQRADYANEREAQLFVSIHCNSSESGEGNGIETYYAEEKAETSSPLAELIQEQVVLQTGARDRSARTADYAVIRKTDMPAVLIEIGFLSDTEECRLLQQNDYQDKIARGIADGILCYLHKSDRSSP